MKQANKDKTVMLSRLARVEGQLRGIQKLIAEEQGCEKIVQQMSAARRALDKAAHEMLACIIEAEVLANDTPSNPAESMAEIRKLLSKYV